MTLLSQSANMDGFVTNQAPDIEMFSTKVVYKNRWMTVREDVVRRRDGSEGIYGIVEKTDSAVIIPMEKNGDLHLVEQYRYPIKRRSWELPMGSWEQKPTLNRIDLANGELREETGLEAATLTHLAYLFSANGHSTHGYDVYLATGLHYVGSKLEQTEQDLVTRRFSYHEVIRMIMSGEIKDAYTVAAMGLFQMSKSSLAVA